MLRDDPRPGDGLLHLDAPNLRFLAGGGEMGARMRAFDWARTPVGCPETWPQSLRSTISMLLPSRAQIILFWGAEFVCFYNDAYRPVFGAKHPHALGAPGAEAWSEIWDTVLHELLDGVVRTGEAFWGKDLLFTLERHGFAEETYFDVSYDPVRVESGEVGGVFCIVTETTERVIGERRMALLKDLASRNAAARTTTEACDLAMRTLSANSQDVTFALAYLDGELLGSTPQAADKSAAAPPALVHELVLPLSGSEQAVRLVVGVSARRPFDDQYRAFVALVADQFATALANARAHEDERKRAEALAQIDRAKTVFFSNVSHEFRTPLTLMLGPAEGLANGAYGALQPQQRQQVEILQRNAGRLLKLVNALLDFSRIEAGRARAAYRRTDIVALTRDLASAFRSAIEHAGLRFDVSCEPIAGDVYVDRDMWEKIVLNLLSNALKFTFEGEITLALRASGDQVELSVRDTGVGIAASELPRIFERFHRVEGVRSRTHEGSGIGLALTHDLVRLHGGTIAAASVQDRGSTFTIRIPTGHAHLPPEAIGAAAETAPGRSVTPFVLEASRWEHVPSTVIRAAAPGDARSPRRSSILIADDNADMRDYLEQLLSPDFDLELTTDGQSAIDAARARHPDLIITDVMMPQLGGFELLRELRNDPAISAIPVLMLSARAGEDARVSGLDAGADDYVVKPFSTRELLARVRSLLALSNARREAELQKQHLRALFMQAPTPIVMLRGPAHVIELANPATCQVWGRREDQVAGKPLLEALPELAGQPFTDHLDRVLESGETYFGKETPAHLRLNDGRSDTVWFNYVYAPLKDVNGRHEGVLVLAFDVSDEVRARDELRRLRAAAESANRAKDEFLAILGHELRNPLAPIVTALELMRLRGDDASMPERQIINRQVRHLTRLVEDLLDVSRIAEGKIDLRRRITEIADIVSAAVETVRPSIAERRQQLSVAVPDTGLRVDGDVTRLVQVVGNVLSNASKYTPPGGHIGLAAEAAGDVVEVRVRDTGIGISADMLPRIFDLFAQESHALDRAAGGLGLGLTIVRSLVRLHGGTVEARSDGLDRGSEFIIRLPHHRG
jgi:PAS domain S-box-containing protein